MTTASRVVVPLARRSGYEKLYSRLNIELSIDGVEVVASFSDLGALDERELTEVVADLSDRRDEILAAIDFLFTGY
ncbi:CcdB family protein [Sinimarinibacterium thermocellulolyticum]|uniref:Toxin CcdB n=1 Tax=Sinimarinibacterium thermocellulolyticum TaxID=3170016 RepID=A0ABV2AD62_9GAMM